MLNTVYCVLQSLMIPEIMPCDMPECVKVFFTARNAQCVAARHYAQILGLVLIAYAAIQTADHLDYKLYHATA